MKKILFILPIYLLTNLAYSQPIYNLPTDYVRNQVFFVNDIAKGQNFEGSPYLKNDFEPGKIMVSDKTYPAMLRYNAFMDVFEIKTGDTQNSQLTKSPNIKISISNDVFELIKIPNGESVYVQQLAKGAKLTFWIQNKMKFNEAKAAKSSYGADKPAAFVLDKNYFITEGSTITELKLKKKEVLQLFADSEEPMKKFIKEQKLVYSEENDVKRMIQFYNNL